MSKLIALIALVILSLSTASVFGQYGGDGPTPAPLEKGRTSGSYHLSEIENINYFSGHLNITIPVAGMKGRGGSAGAVNLSFDSPGWRAYVENIDDNTGNGGTVPASFAAYEFTAKITGIPKAEFRVQYASFEPQLCLGQGLYSGLVTRVAVTMADGSEYELRDTLTDGKPQEMTGCQSFPSRGQVFVSKDGTNMKYVADSAVLDVPFGTSGPVSGGYLYLPDGTVLHFGPTGLADWTRDRNGNLTTYQNPVTPDFITGLTDSVGRKITFASTTGNPVDTAIAFNGTNGEDRQITLESGEFRNNLRSGEVFLPIEDLFESFYQIGGYDGNNSVVTAVNLPNGQTFEFKYNTYGEIAWMKLPTGGIVEYDWSDGAGGTGGQVNSGTVVNTFIYRRLVARRVYADGVNLTSTTTISRPEHDQVGYVDVKRYGSSELLSFERHYYYGTASSTFSTVLNTFFYPAWKTGREYKTEILNPADSSMLRKIEHAWEQNSPSWWTSSCGYCGDGDPDEAPANNPRITETKTTLENSSISKRTFTYDSNLNLTDTYEYDYGSGSAGSLLRRTHTDYLTTNPVNSTDYTIGSLYVLTLPSANWVSTDAAGSNKVSLTEFEYDNYSTDSNHAGLASRNSVVGHDSTNFGTGFTYRGNLTGVTSYANAGSQTGGVTGYSQYDMLGNVVKSIDANGNETTVSYSDNFGVGDSDATTNTAPAQLNGLNAFAFPTSTTNPLSWTACMQYDYFTGAPVNAQDVNGLTSKTIYDDDLDRPTRMVTAIGTANEIQSSVVYDDANRRIESTSDLFALNDNLARSEGIYDGLGRTMEARSYSEGDYVSVKSEYDALGRTKRVSNPFRPTRSETPIWTATTYDSLGRVIEVETPDGASSAMAYDGNRTLAIDQAGKQRLSKVNALGQLKDVWEITATDGSTESVSFPNLSFSAGYRTSYTYDGLGNLAGVSQGSQSRTFTYDNLSRLLSAVNPESGTVSYTYDASGNLKTKRDARNIKTVYDYDVLKRVTKRCYRSIGAGSLGMTTCADNNETAEPNTSDVTYTFENTSVTNLKGVLTKVANGISSTEYIAFDATGRIMRTKQTTDGVVYGDDTNPMTYTYSVSGALLEQKYPSGRVVKNVLDQDGRLELLQSKKNQNAGYWTYGSSFAYNASGANTSMQLGNGRWESTTFNSRLQPTQIALGTVAGGYDKLKLNYSYGDWVSGSIDGTRNNGNVVQQVIVVPTGGGDDGFTATQKYYYDSLNRIDDATEDIAGVGQTWRQDFTYDRYGNRNFNETNTTTLPKLCGTAPNFTVCPEDQKKYNPSFATTNRINTSNDYAFDSSGNTTEDAFGRTFVYDAENHQIEVKDDQEVTIGQYWYDGDGKRIKKYVPDTGEITIFVYDSAGKQIAEYSTIVASTNDAKVAYLTNDHLGSPRINTDANGAVIARHDYHAFGKEIETTQRVAHAEYASDTIRKKFTGYERDTESGLDFAQARYFDGNSGRFSTPDHFSNDTHVTDPQSWNLYVYVRNNPLKYVDPTGTDLVFNLQGATYKVERTKVAGPLRVVDSNGKPGGGKELAAVTTMLNNLDNTGGLNNEVNRLIDSGSHVMDLGFGTDNPGGATGPSQTDPQFTRSGVSLNISNEEATGESTIVLGTEIMSAAYLASQNNLNAAYAYGQDAKGNQVEQFNNNPDSPLPGSTTYEQFRAQSSSDLRRRMGISPARAILPPASRPQGTGSAPSAPTVPDDLGPPPPPPARRAQPSENNTPIQRRSRP